MTKPSLTQRLCTLCGVQFRRQPHDGAAAATPESSADPTSPGSDAARPSPNPPPRTVPLRGAVAAGALSAGLAAGLGVWWGADSHTPAESVNVVNGTTESGSVAADDSGRPRLLPNLGAELRPLAASRRTTGGGGAIALAQHEEESLDDLDALGTTPFDQVELQPPAATSPEVSRVVRALEEPAPRLPQDKVLSFNFRSAPWDLVLTKFAEEVGLPLEMRTVPQGTLTHYDPRPYSAADALHVLNHLLRSTGCGLVQEGGRLVVADLRSLSQMPAPESAPPVEAATVGGTASAVAQMQMRMARIDLEEGRLESARQTALDASRQDATYGLLEERPDQMLQDIERRRAAAAPAHHGAPATMPAVTAAAEIVVATPTAPAPPFTFEPAPWEDVLRHYAEANGLTLEMPAAPPGHMAHRDGRVLSATEAFDALNGLLYPQGYLLVRRDGVLSVVRLSEGIPRRLIREVTPHELSSLGRSDLVCLVVAASDAEIDALTQHIGPALGPLGGVERLAQPTRLRIIDTAGNLRRVAQMLAATGLQQTAGR